MAPLSDTPDGNSAQIRLIAEQLVRASIIEVRNEQQGAAAIPPMLKWVGALISAVLTALITAGCIWMAVTLSEMKVAVSNIELQLGDKGALSARFNEIERRVGRLEQDRVDDERGKQ